MTQFNIRAIFRAITQPFHSRFRWRRRRRGRSIYISDISQLKSYDRCLSAEEESDYSISCQTIESYLTRLSTIYEWEEDEIITNQGVNVFLSDGEAFEPTKSPMYCPQYPPPRNSRRRNAPNTLGDTGLGFLPIPQRWSTGMLYLLEGYIAEEEENTTSSQTVIQNVPKRADSKADMKEDVDSGMTTIIGDEASNWEEVMQSWMSWDL